MKNYYEIAPQTADAGDIIKMKPAKAPTYFRIRETPTNNGTAKAYDKKGRFRLLYLADKNIIKAYRKDQKRA